MNNDVKPDDIYFTAKDFFDYLATPEAIQIAEAANAILKAKLDRAVEVFGDKYSDTDNARGGWTTSPHWGTHRARLVCIEKLESPDA